jgi:peptidoglycan/xylan/chitin deacetylase (PgdA/CDA1 family)
MNVDQLRDLATRGHDIHSHSRTHPRLSSLATAEIAHELEGSKADLEAILNTPVTRFSIPGGAFDTRVVDAAKRARYSAVLNSVEGYNDAASSPFLLRRFTPRSYSDVSMLVDICERPRYTAARLAIKRTALTVARGLLGRARYEKARSYVVSAVRRT